jgi:hypothetical protein
MPSVEIPASVAVESVAKTSSEGTLEPELLPVLKQRETQREAAPSEEVSGSDDLKDAALTEAKDFNWEALVEHTRKNYVALYSVLSKCGHELVGNTLTLYTNSAFYKKKIDDQKYNTHLYEALKSIGSYELVVHTVPTPLPPKDSQAAAVAAIMGGGEEVAI